jgi:hypothetical protein
VGLAVLWLLTAVAGAVCAGLVRVPLRLEERVALAIVMGIVGGSLLTLLVGLAAGLTAFTALLGPILLLAAAASVATVLPAPSPARMWADSWGDARRRRWERDTWILGLFTVFAVVGFWRLFAHTLFSDGEGGITAGFATVWADWSLHSTLASSFSVAANLPPHDPIFSGGSLRYPFLPDFHAAIQEAAGGSVAVALALPCAVLCTAAALLVVSLGRRLSGSLAVGILAILLCLAGGSLGWRTLWWDACTAAGQTAAACAPSTMLTHPGTAVDVLRAVPQAVATQSRNYDNLENPDPQQITDTTAVQWYTPLLAWWLPQRTFVYGFAIGAAVLLLAIVALRAPPRTRSPFVAAGLLAGTLPLIHIHTLIALGIVVGIWALMRWRTEWLWTLGATLVLAVPRLLQVAAGGTGVSDPACPPSGTKFPYFEVGWMSQPAAAGDSCNRPGWSEFSASGAVTAFGRLLVLPFNGDFWAFWLDNNGVVLVVALVLGLAALVALVSWGWIHAVAAAVKGTVDAELLRFALPFLAVFLIANVVVFQTWDWDNTKLLAWWYLGGGLLTGAWIAAWWRHGGWRALVASAALVSLVLSAGLSLTRILQQEGAHSGGGPYGWASAADIELATTVEARTAQSAVFLIPANNPTQPVLTIAGRTALLGYEGWLYSYGVDTKMRPADRDTVYQGCQAGAAAACPIPGILATYGIDYVVVPLSSGAAAAWFGAAYPSVATGPSSVVYDVRGRPAASAPARPGAGRA